VEEVAVEVRPYQVEAGAGEEEEHRPLQDDLEALVKPCLCLVTVGFWKANLVVEYLVTRMVHC
jgi:hypothetical protein